MTQALHYAVALVVSLGIVTGCVALLAYARWADLP